MSLSVPDMRTKYSRNSKPRESAGGREERWAWKQRSVSSRKSEQIGQKESLIGDARKRREQLRNVALGIRYRSGKEDEVAVMLRPIAVS